MFLSELAPLAKDGNLEKTRTLHKRLSDQQNEFKSVLLEFRNIKQNIRAFETASAPHSPKEKLHYDKLKGREKELESKLAKMDVRNPPPGVDWITYIDIMLSDVVDDLLKDDEP